MTLALPLPAAAGRRTLATIAIAAFLAAGCASPPPVLEARSVRIERTEFHVVHVTANDMESLGYGTAYAYAEDNVCALLENLLTARGERSRFLGGTAQGLLGLRTLPNAQIDLFVRSHMDDAALAAAYATTSDEAKAATRGTIAGFNRYLADTGAAQLPAACRDAAWVGPMTAADLYRMTEISMIQLGLGLVPEAILGARPPAASTGDAAPSADTDAAWAALADPEAWRIGSNGWAFGSEATSARTGLLLGNPHFPWIGPNRFWQLHLTIPGRLDVMGASIGASPVVQIGFNRDVAWTHTVSTGKRYTLYELALVPGDPTSYLVDGVPRKMTSATTTIDVRGDDGRTTQQSATTWSTVWGPVVVMPRSGLAWTREHAYAIRDANAGNPRLLDTWMAMDRATGVESLREAMGRQGIPWVNTMAADRDGKVLYADLSSVPDVTAADLQRCAPTPAAAALFASAGIVVLDGSRAACGWRRDAASTAPGLIPPARMPVVVRRDYVQNSNDSYWLSNPKVEWPEISPLVGLKATPQGLRTRIGLMEIQRQLAGQNGSGGARMDPRDVELILFSDANLAGLLVMDDVKRLCADAATATQRDACAALARWDRTSSLDAVGAPLFREFWRRASQARNVWRVPFDAARPVETPSGLNLADASVEQALLQALDEAAKALQGAGVALDATLRTAQVKRTPHGPVPVPGGESPEGVLNVVQSPGIAAAAKGYDITFGSSYLQLVTFDAEGPVARGMLTYGQSSDPASPYAYDQLDTFSKGDWPRLPFSRREIEARRVGAARVLTLP